MAIANRWSTCKHCGQEIALRTYAAPYSPDEHERTYGIKIWTNGQGQYPGDQKWCLNTIDDECPTLQHEPVD